ncbi:MAG: NADH-quinone oxidoreductase subunit M [Candidatus Contendobacter sp.]|nr:NADH-quinone oxidoreductase subunit M [Candidatus Contendobacter sp.]
MFEWIAGLVPALPLAAALWIGAAILFGRASGEARERRTSRIALTALSAAFVAMLALVAARLAGELPERLTLGRWLSSGTVQVEVNFLADRLGLTLTTLATLLCLLVTRFSVNYLHREAGFHRFFLILSLFSAAMPLLFLSGNAVLTFVGWEVAGLCSYLLIAFFQDRPAAAANATRAFVTNRIGDAGFLLGIAMAFHWLGGVDWATVNAGAAGLSSSQAGILAGCFLLAAVAKSGQIPLAPWLARAMEGPTPSSALFYGAVMVHAGVYLLLRLQPLFEQSPAAMAALAIIGLATALYGFWAGLAQTDIKSALIFSTTGQLGLMFLACGLGLWTLALIHLCGHAIVRGYQFLRAPSVLYPPPGTPVRPVPAFLARRHRAYAAALQRFWLEDVADWTVVRPVRRLARVLNRFDTVVVDRATGLPAPAVNALSSLAQWEERQVGAGRILERAPNAADRDPGILGWITERTATLVHGFEELLVFRAVGQGIVATSRRLGNRLGRIERGLRRSWAWMAATLVVLIALVGLREIVRAGESPDTGLAGFPLLSLLLLTPLVGMVAAWRIQRIQTALTLGLATAGVELLLTIAALIRFDPHDPAAQLVERFEPLPWLNLDLGIDGLGVLFLPLTALLTLLILLYAQTIRRERPGVLVAGVLAQEAALMGMFTALNLMQFWLFALAEIIPVAFLVWRWGTSPVRGRAAWRLVRDLSSGLAALLAGILLLGWNHATAMDGVWSFDLSALLATPASPGLQSLIFVLLFGGLAVRLALFPFHAWLPVVAQHGTVAVGLALLAGVKVGVYALLRFAFPLLPTATQQWAGAVIALGLIGMGYGALLALMQKDLRRLLAFAVVSHTGALLVGLFALNPPGLQGSLLLSLNLGLATAGLFLVAGLLQRRLGVTRFYRLGGLFDAAPLLGLTFLVVVLGSIAMPGTPGFEAAHLALEGVLETCGWGVATLAASGNVLAAGYLLWSYQRIFLARNPRGTTRPLTDLRNRELVMAGLLCAVMVSVGLYAHPWLETISGAVENVAGLFEVRAGH